MENRYDMTPDEEKSVTCGRLAKGEVAYGILKETGLPEKKEAK